MAGTKCWPPGLQRDSLGVVWVLRKQVRSPTPPFLPQSTFSNPCHGVRARPCQSAPGEAVTGLWPPVGMGALLRRVCSGEGDNCLRDLTCLSASGPVALQMPRYIS